jgi:hypothetical protein
MDSYDASASLDLIRTSAHTPIDYGEDTFTLRFTSRIPSVWV